MIRTFGAGSGAEGIRIEGATLPVRVLILPAWFDEANRMRRATVRLMAALAAAEVGSLLPDLPGTGESERPLARIGWADWTDAVAGAGALLPPWPRLTVGLRGGALLDHFLAPGARARHWRLAPDTGGRLLRDLDRTGRIGAAADYPIAPALRAAIAAAEPVASDDVRTVRLAGDPAPAHLHVEGARLWRQAEPGADDALVDRLAADIAEWARACAKR